MFSIDKTADPYTNLKFFREQAPVYYSPQQNAWFIYRYDDVKKLLKESKNLYQVNPDFLNQTLFDVNWMSNDDPNTKNKCLRAPFSKALTSSMDSLNIFCKKKSYELLSNMKTSRLNDFAKYYCKLLPSLTICYLLGIEEKQASVLYEWTHTLLGHLLGDGSLDKAIQAKNQAYDLIEGLFNNKLICHNNFMDSILESTSLSVEEIKSNLVLILIGGNVSTGYLIGNLVYRLLSNESQFNLIKKTPNLTDNAVEETLRFDPVFPISPRFNRTEISLGEYKIPAHSQINLCIASANRDEKYQVDAEKFNIERDRFDHLSFGYGFHYCLGSEIARLQARITLETILQFFPDMVLVKEQNIKWSSSPFIHGPDELNLII